MNCKLQIFLCMICGLMLCSCQEELLSGRGMVEEGIPTTIKLNVSTEGNEVVTRAAQSEETEKALYNLYVFVFDKNDNVITRKEFSKADVDAGSLSIRTVSMNSAKIYGIANYTTSLNVTSYVVNQQTLNNISSLNELESLTVSLAVNAINRGSSFLMSGFATDGNGTDDYVQLPPQSGTTINLNLRRMDAKITFNIKAEQPAGTTNISNFSFRPTEWKVCQLPKQTLLVESAQGDFDTNGTAGDDNYFSTEAYAFEEIENPDPTKDLYTGSFTFYMPENKKTPKKTIPATNDQGTSLTVEEQYKLREKRDEESLSGTTKPGQNYTPGNFTYSNKYSTYVVLTGWLSYKEVKDGNTYQINALANYIVHLGGINDTGGIDANNYNTNRNTHYTYNITVSGINDMKVEVEDGNEVRPGHEGTAIVNEKTYFEFDAHYCRGYLEITKEDLLKLAVPDAYLTWSVKTPFSSGMHTANGDPVPEELNDYKWVKFALNKEYTFGRGWYAKYPGDQNYLGDGSTQSDYAYNKPPGNIYGTGSQSTARLLDINQLCERLKAEALELKQNENNPDYVSKILTGDVVPITIYLDEYVYYFDPIKEDPYLYANRGKTPDTGENLWKKFVNASDREMHVSLGEIKYSADGNTSIVNSVFAGYQKSIKSLYNFDYQGQYGATKRIWGMESTLEQVVPTEQGNGGGTLLPKYAGEAYYGADKTFDDTNGRPNTIAYAEVTYLTSGKAWDTYLNHYATYEGYLNTSVQDARTDVFAALLSRNRDSDGDGVLDINEIKWYLASRDQLVDIYIGQPALDEANYLYPPRAEDRPDRPDIRWHYLTSNCYDYHHLNNPKLDNYVIWAEEGASISNYQISNASYGKFYTYRFLRNLGVLPEKDCIVEPSNPNYRVDNWPQNLIDVSAARIDATRLNPKALREYVSGTLPEHDDNDYNNRLFKSVYIENYNTWGGNWGQCKEAEKQFVNMRLPNQRELLALTRWPSNPGSKIYMSKTSFSKAGTHPYGQERKTFTLNAGNKTLGVWNGYEIGYLLKVRDEK